MRNNIWGYILVSMGVLFLLDNLGIAAFGDIMHHFWPIILILVGLNMIFRSRRIPTANTPTPQPRMSEVPPPPLGNVPPPNYSTTSSNYSSTINIDMFNASEVFGELHFDVVSQNFRGGRVSNVFGEVKIDLTKVTLADGDSVLDVSTVFGGITLLVPREMQFAIQANITIGDIRVFDQKRDGMFSKLNFKTANFDASLKRLHIVTSSVFGECKVW